MITAERSSHGSMPRSTSRPVIVARAGASTSGLAVAAGRGVQKRSSVVVAAIDASALSTSAAYGPHVFDTTNCATAKLTPATTAAGQVRRRPSHPATTSDRYAGSTTERSGSCRPTAAPSRITSSPVTLASATIGTPTLPKATGAVFESSETTTARFGAKPTPTSKKAVIATGAPNPALPSSSAPKQNATSTACTHGSPEAR